LVIPLSGHLHFTTVPSWSQVRTGSQRLRPVDYGEEPWRTALSCPSLPLLHTMEQLQHSDHGPRDPSRASDCCSFGVWTPGRYRDRTLVVNRWRTTFPVPRRQSYSGQRAAGSADVMRSCSICSAGGLLHFAICRTGHGPCISVRVARGWPEQADESEDSYRQTSYFT
jgi:hypothetical protein